jgi:phage terminase large subunit-like protein
MTGAGSATVEPLVLLAPYRALFHPNPSWRYAFLTGGRGSGKSFHLSVFLLNLTYESGHVILFTRYTMESAGASIIPEFVDKLERLGKRDDFDITQKEIVNKWTGSRILFRGIKTSSGNQTAKLKSIQGVTTWVLDEAEELVDRMTFDRIDDSIRSQLRPNRVILSLNPSTVDHFLHGLFVAAPRADTLYIHTTWQDNRDNLSESFLAKIEETRTSNPGRYAHIYAGEWLREVAGLLWTPTEIQRARVATAPDDLSRVLVAIDPAVTANAESDETGIVVVGADRNRRGYVLEDLSGRYSPNQWATIAIDAARRWKGSIVAETNQGGDMVTAVLKSLGDRANGIRIIDVKASRGKLARAEPVYSLYQEQRIFHVGAFPLLESQMVGFNPENQITSPDRVDALVWGLSALLLTGAQAFVV